MAAQVLMPHVREGGGLLDAMTRAFQAYNAFQSGREAGAKADYFNAPKDDALSSDKLADFVKGGGSVSDEQTPDSTPVLVHSQDADGNQITKPAFLKPPASSGGLAAPKEVFNKKTGSNQYVRMGDNGAIADLSGNDIDPATIEPPHTNKDKDQGAKEQSEQFNKAHAALDAVKGHKDITTALSDRYSVQKIEELADQANGNLDNLNPQQKDLFVQELGKLAAGGAATETELGKLNPNAYAEMLARAKQKITNDLASANAGKFLDNYLDYAQGIGEKANNLILSRSSGALNSYKRYLTKEDVDNLRSEFLDPYQKDVDRYAQLKQQKKDSNVAASSGQGGGFGTANAAPPSTPFVPGSIIEVGGKQMKVNADGKTASPL